MMRSVLLIVLGLVIGAAGAVLFVRSLPPEKDSAEEQTALLQRELERRELRIQELEGMEFYAKERLRREADNSKLSIMRDIKAGRTVDLNDVFNAAKPFLNEFAPFFNRVRNVQLRKDIEGTLAELTKEYQLTSAQQQAVQHWLQERAAQYAQRWQDVVADRSSTLKDFAEASQEFRPREELDSIMAQQLSGDILARYQRKRLEEKATKVQYEADQRVAQLNEVVALDEAQKDQVFSLMARSSRDFDPNMQLEGLGQETSALSTGQSRDEAILNVLHPEQRQQYEAERMRRRAQAEADMSELGLRLPEDWDMFNHH